MMQKKFNDHVIEQIFNSIPDFDGFYSDLITKSDINLQNEIKIRFIEKLNLVEIYVKQDKYVVEDTVFDNIIKEIIKEKKRMKFYFSAIIHTK